MTKEDKKAQLQKYIEECWKHGATISYRNKYDNRVGICPLYDGTNFLVWKSFDYFLETYNDYDLGI